MKKLFTFILCLFFVSTAYAGNLKVLSPFLSSTPATPTITYDTSSTGYQVWGTTVSWTHTLADNPNNVVIVLVGASGGVMDITGCTWDQGGTPIAMTALTSYNFSTFQKLRMFYILDPTVTGTVTIQATTSAATKIIGHAISIYNATETGSSTTTHDGSTVDATSISDTLTTSTDGSWVVTGGFVNINEDLSTTQGETERLEVRSATLTVAIATEEIATAGVNTFGWSGAGSDNRIICMAEFKPL